MCIVTETNVYVRFCSRPWAHHPVTWLAPRRCTPATQSRHRNLDLGCVAVMVLQPQLAHWPVILVGLENVDLVVTITAVERSLGVTNPAR